MVKYTRYRFLCIPQVLLSMVPRNTTTTTTTIFAPLLAYYERGGVDGINSFPPSPRIIIMPKKEEGKFRYS